MHAAPTTAFDIPDLVDRLSRLVNNEQLRQRGQAAARTRYAWPAVIFPTKACGWGRRGGRQSTRGFHACARDVRDVV